MFRSATTPSCRRSLTRLFSTTGARASYAGDAAAHCKDFVRKHDYESYLQSVFYPPHLQAGYFALKAFFLALRFV